MSGAIEQEEDRRRRNLEAVGRHLMQGAAPASVAAAEPGMAPAPTARPGAWRLGSIGALLAMLLGKLKVLVPLLKLVKLSTLATMAISIGAYAMEWGFAFAAGFVLLIFVHEMGHAWMMRRQGIPAGAPIFIPFVGALIAMKGRPRDAWVEALVAIAGPLVGSAGALVCLGIGLATGRPFWIALASTGFLLNLFNLLPVPPLDGGRIVPAMSRWLWIAGYAGCIALWVATHSPLLLVILLLGLIEAWRAFRRSDPAYLAVAPRRRLLVAVGYFGLAGLLAIAHAGADLLLASWHAARG